jgi:hypothetical protein
MWDLIRPFFDGQPTAGSLPDWSKTMLAGTRDGGEGEKLVLALCCGKVKW